MEIKLHEIPIHDVFDGYENNEETGQVIAYGGKLNVRPAYQREFVYDDKKKVAVMNSILHQFPLNVRSKSFGASTSMLFTFSPWAMSFFTFCLPWGLWAFLCRLAIWRPAARST